MKKVLCSMLILSMICIITSCTKQSSSDLYTPAPDEIIYAKIAPGQTYSLNLNSMGSVSITKLGVHFSVSEIIAANENTSAVYKYVPAAGFSGSDEVMLNSSFTSIAYNSGCNNNNGNYTITKTKNVIIKIDVTK